MGCHDAPMTDPMEDLPTTKGANDSMRLAGFGLTALAGLLIGVGSLLPWIRSSLEGLPDDSSPTYYGIDIPDGLIALTAAAVVLVGLAITQLATSTGARKLAAGAAIAASCFAIVVATAAVLTATSRFEPTAVDDVLAELDASGEVSQEQREQVEELVVIRLAPGPFVVLGGGLLGLAGGVMLLLWASRQGTTEETQPGSDRAPTVGEL
jgi:hypothetical protein